MKKIVGIVIVCIAFVFQGHAQKKNAVVLHKPATIAGYQISLTVRPFKKTWIYIGSYYGKYQNLVDSVFLDNNSSAIWKGAEKKPQGIYFLVSPAKSLLNEFLVDRDQYFSIVTDTSNLKQMVITGSKDNTIYQNYTQYIAQSEPQLRQWNQQLQVQSADSIVLRKNIKDKIAGFDTYRQNIIKQYPGSIMADYFQVMKVPQLKVAGKDTAAAFYAVKEHYWDNVDFNDDKILRTPFFDRKLDDYYKYYVSPVPDSVIGEVDYMLLASRDSKDLHHYLLGRFTDEYINPRIMGQDKVFLFLFNNYFSKGDTLWLNPQQRKYIFDRAYSLMANQIGTPAPTLALKDSLGKIIPLQSLEAKYVFLLFWDPDCSHCKVVVPKVDSIYRAKWKALGVKVYAVNTSEEGFSKWNAFVLEHHLGDWINVTQSKEERDADAVAQRPNFRQLFDVYETPTMLLLDKDKNIIAKRLSIQQFDGLIDSQGQK